jgi:hypothetical protein
MSRRMLALLALVVTVSSMTACADSLTAPERRSMTPSATPIYDAMRSGSCKGGWVSSTGRCG